MSAIKINKRFVDTATCAGKQQMIYWDSELKGFGLRVTPTRKTYVAQSRVEGKTVRITLGLHGPLTPDQARIEAKKRLGEMAVGININKVERNAKLKGITLLDAYNEYIKSRALTENTLRDYAKAMRLGFPDWHHKTIQSINRDLIENRFNSLSKKSSAQANQIFRFLRALLNFAKEKYTSEDGEPLIPSNPCDRLTALKKWHPITRRTPSKYNASTLHLEDNQLIAVENDARSFGFEWPNSDMILDQAISETAEIRKAINEKESSRRIQEAVGDLLHTVISLCIFLGYNVDQTLEFTSEKFAARMNALKAAAHQLGLKDLKGQTTEFMLQLWRDIKQLEKV